VLKLLDMRKLNFTSGEFYHVYNRGVDSRDIFVDKSDVERFVKSANEFNGIEPIGSLLENSYGDHRERTKKDKRLINIVCYALNPNHYHFILEQLEDQGIEKFMHRLGTGYTMFFNKKYKRSGALFQGVFKAIPIGNNEYLLHLSAYVNLNDKIHQLGGLASKLAITSLDQYVSNLGNDSLIKIDNEIIVSQFNSPKEYEDFVRSSLPELIENKRLKKELDNIYLEE